MLLCPYNNPTLVKETIIVHNCVLACPINSIISFNEMFILFNTFSLVSGLFIILVVILVLENIAKYINKLYLENIINIIL